MPSFIIVECMWQILGRCGFLTLPPNSWATPKKPILNTVNLIYLSINSSIGSYTSNIRCCFFNIYILALCTFFLITSFFTTLLNLLKSTETDNNLLTSIYLLYFSNCLNHLLLFNLSISNLSTLDFNLAKSTF